MIVMQNVRLFDGENIYKSATVEVEGQHIATVLSGETPPRTDSGCQIVDGRNHTLLPGLIDAHTHVFGSVANLRTALAFGVTTELDMFSFPPELTSLLYEVVEEDDGLADLLSAGSVVCKPGGHPTQLMTALPTLSQPQEAEEFVAQRHKEGSRLLKLIFDNGRHAGFDLEMLDLDTASAAVRAGHARNMICVAHACDIAAVRMALSAGVDALTHVPVEGPLPEDVVRQCVQQGVTIIPTLTMMEMSTADTGRALAGDVLISQNLSADDVHAIRCGREGLAVGGGDLRHAMASTLRLHRAGVPVLAGTDANNAPGRLSPVVHGASLHRELELLVKAGLTPLEALASTTSGPADLFNLTDRGRVEPGRNADLVLVAGDPTTDITATRSITRVWRRGTPFDLDGFRASVT